jgi:hypothetical protein
MKTYEITVSSTYAEELNQSFTVSASSAVDALKAGWLAILGSLTGFNYVQQRGDESSAWGQWCGGHNNIRADQV